jgi:DNA-binding transcriptional LysR family regulator
VAARIDLNRIDTFVRVVQAGSFTAAAAALSLPTSSVSRAVTRLEEELGARLLHRTTRKLRLTDAGQHYFERMKLVISEVEEASQTASGASAQPSGLVRLTAPADIVVRLLPPLLAGLAARYPLLVIDVTVTGRRVDLIDEGVDLAIRAGPALDDSAQVARKLGNGTLGMFAARSYLERHGRPRTLADLANHACIVQRARAGRVPWRLSGPRGEETAPVRPAVVTDDMLFAHEAIVAGLGIGLVPVPLADSEPPARRPLRVLPSYTLKGAIYLVSPSRRLVPARVAVVRDYLFEELRKLF